MAFRQKFQAIKALRPDILVISESESPGFLRQKNADLPWSNHLWIGDNPAKGLSVFASDKYQLQLKENHDPSIRFVAPVTITGPQQVFDLYAVWTQAEKTLSQGYVSQMLNGVATYGDDLAPGDVLAGDFNSSPVFKTNGKKHLELVENLASFGFSSAYHSQHNQAHGHERQPSFYLHRNRAKPYHLDYVFCHQSHRAKITIGAARKWLRLSDHMPLIVDFTAPG